MPPHRLKPTLFRHSLSSLGWLAKTAPPPLATAIYRTWSRLFFPVAVPGWNQTLATPCQAAAANTANTSVTVIIPTRDHPAMLLDCVSALAAKAGPINFEILIVNNGRAGLDQSGLARAAQAAGAAVRVLDAPGRFNYSRCNNQAARQCAGELLLLLNDDVTAASPGFLQEMAGLALRPEVGAVGALLYYPNGIVQHAGIYTERGRVRHYAQFLGRDGFTSNPAACCRRLVSAVTGACLLIRRDLFLRIGGFDAELATDYNDVDLCFRLLRLGYRNVFTPGAELLHRESFTRGHGVGTRAAWARRRREYARLAGRHGDYLEADPYLQRLA